MTESDDRANAALSGKKGIKKSSGKARRTILFPAGTFENALELPQAIFRAGAGKPVRRVTLLDELGKSPNSSASRQLITNGSKYGLTNGSYSADILELTPLGLAVVGDTSSPAEQARAKFELAIKGIPVFKRPL